MFISLINVFVHFAVLHFLSEISSLANRFHFCVRVYCNRSQMTSWLVTDRKELDEVENSWKQAGTHIKTNLKAVTEQEQRHRLCFATKHVTQFKPVHFSNARTMRR